MQHAATDSVPASPVLTSDVPHPSSSSSSSSPFDQYKVICRNGSVLMRRQPHRGTMHIKDIHDRVESGLMRSGEHDVARTSVLYRKELTRSRARAVTMKRRCQKIGMDALYPGAINPFPWMAEMIDLKNRISLKPVSLNIKPVARCPGIYGT